MAHRNGAHAARVRRAENFGRKNISAAIARALGLRDHKGSAAAARKLRYSARQLNNYLNLRTGYGVIEEIANRPEYAVEFARCFLVAMRRRAKAERRAA